MSLFCTAALFTAAGPANAEDLALPAGNILSNPSFETNLTGWSTWQGTLARVSHASAPDGAYVVRVTRSAGDAYSLDDAPDAVASTTVGTVYRAQVFIAASNAGTVGKPVVLAVRERNGAGTSVGYAESPEVGLTTAFQQLTVETTVQQTGNTLDVYVLQSNATAGNAFLVDALTLAVVPPPTPGEPSQLLWSDEFDGLAGTLPNPQVWEPVTGGMWDNGRTIQQYTARPQNVQHDGSGHLKIIARRETYTGADGVTRDYTSARIHSKGRMERQYGYVEVRLKAPTGLGTWPAAWMMGSTGEWPANGEFDIFEGEGPLPTLAHGTIHAPGIAYGWGPPGQVDYAPARVGDAWRTFGIFWNANRVEWYADRIKRFTFPRGTTGTWVFDQPNHLLLNLALGDLGGDPTNTVFPQVLEVDYVRWYANAPSN
ncbi:family 16 glycosylhydrolase [Myxococcus sp. CA033]|uniref:family 16 glycosylhydrolase n=1 Tax=Myxococcus sp. CA033 TaxID=2741516 RepID=UPI00157AD588|nr:family 16 glycosylhydrolase [Myxococcus sp. CA033]NTX34768.1 family 16 glycosylhydrolase [Myxococcus sp. CA033]